MFLVVPEILSHCNAAVWRYELKWGRFAGGGRYHYAVLPCPVLCKGVHDPCHCRTLLADGYIYTYAVLTLLVNYGIKGNGSFSCLPVAYYKLSLTASDWNHPVNCLDPGLQRLMHRLPVNDPRGLYLDLSEALGLYWSLAVYSLSKGVNNPSDQLLADRNLNDLSSPLYYVPFLYEVVFTKYSGSDIGLFKVQPHAEDVMRELEDFACHCLFQAVDTGDTVTDGEDSPSLAHLHLFFVVFDLRLDYLADLFCSNLHFLPLKNLNFSHRERGENSYTYSVSVSIF